MQSSAKSLVLELMSSGRSFIKIKNSTGPRTDPCGTPRQQELSPMTVPLLGPAGFWNLGMTISTGM